MSQTRGRSRPIDILLVESNPGDTRLIKELFASSGVPSRFEVKSVSTLEDGIVAIRERDFEVVLLDMDLPENPGLDSVRSIRSVAPSVPIVITSNLDDEEADISSLEAGAEDYLCKSELNASLLVHSVTYALQRRMLTESLLLRTGQVEEQKSRALAYFDLMAHDVANLITPILLICDVIVLKTGITDEIRTELNVVSSQAKRASSILVNLRMLEELERTNPDEVGQIDLIEAISDLKKGIMAESQHPSVEFSVHSPDVERVIVKGGRWTRHVVSHLLRDSVSRSKADEVHVQVTISPVKDPSGKSFWQMEIAGNGLPAPDGIAIPLQSSIESMRRCMVGVATDKSFCASFVDHIGGELSIREDAKGGSHGDAVTILRLPRGE
ncbi:MAG: response regulator [Thermoplasmata archaeon]